jgi:alcohol dehydrogenase class IV
MRFNLPKRQKEFVAIGQALGGVKFSGSLEEDALATIHAIEQLRADVGIPLRLREIGVEAAMLPGFAAKAFAIKRLMRVNPRHPESENDILAIYEAAF